MIFVPLVSVQPVVSGVSDPHADETTCNRSALCCIVAGVMSEGAERERLLHENPGADEGANLTEADQNFAVAEKKRKPTAMRLLKFGRPELPLVILATFLSSISAFLHMSQNVFVGMVINTVHTTHPASLPPLFQR